MSPWLMMENRLCFGAHETEHAITVKFLHPCIPAPCFVFPEQEDLLDTDLSDVLTCVNATTATGRTYTLSRKEMQEASVALKAGIHGATSCRFVACNSNEYGQMFCKPSVY
eukprot:Em0486g3a